MSGILLLDKPLGISSNSALQKAKRLLHAKKVGHTGSLDPLASGMLPLCFGEATKYSRFFLEADKCYQTVMHLGQVTTTGDSEGEVLESHVVPDITSEKLTAMVNHFLGETKQTPPMYSAIKLNGQPLYKLARQGIEVERQARLITIKQLSVDKIEKNEAGTFITLTVVCSKGTYIRTLVSEMGFYLGSGAYVAALHRLWVSPFAGYKMVSLSELQALTLLERQSKIISILKILSDFLPPLCLSSEESFFLKRGQSVVNQTEIALGLVTLVNAQGEFLGVGEKLPTGEIAPFRLVAQ